MIGKISHEDERNAIQTADFGLLWVSSLCRLYSPDLARKEFHEVARSERLNRSLLRTYFSTQIGSKKVDP
jgi:hypothetical protein